MKQIICLLFQFSDKNICIFEFIDIVIFSM